MKKIVNFVVGLLVTIFLVWFLLKQISVRDILGIFNELPILFILLAFLFYTGSLLLRSVRFKVLIEELPFRRMFDMVCVHNMMLNILPARTGEVSFIYLVKKTGLRGTKAVAALVISRIFDFISLSLLFLLFALFIERVSIAMGEVIDFIILFALLLIICLLFVVYFGNLSLKIIRKLVAILGIGRLRGVPFLMEKIEFLIKSFEIVRLNKKFSVILFVSILIFVAQFLMMYVLIIGMDITIPFISMFTAIALFSIVSSIPIQSLAGLGTFEGFWTLSFVLVGLDKSLSISSGFVQHILLIVFFLILGFYGMLQIKLKKKVI